MFKKKLVADTLLQKPKIRRIAILAYPGAEVLDMTGPYEVFAFAAKGLQLEGLTTELIYSIDIVAARPGPISTMTGLQIVANRSYADIGDHIDTLIIPGSIDMQAINQDQALLEWVTSMQPQVRRLASVCTGAFILAECGFLNYRRATTHWNWCDTLAKQYPTVEVDPDSIFIRSDSIYTSGGITSGIDLALSMVEEDWGMELALHVARYLVMFLKRPGGQSQFSAYLTNIAHHRSDLRDLQTWIIANPEADLQIDRLAERVAMSTRHFARTFLAETGVTPAKFIEMVRIDAARQFLDFPGLSIESVANQAGFRDTERMRRSFIKHLGINPQDYRKRFCSHIKEKLNSLPA